MPTQYFNQVSSTSRTQEMRKGVTSVTGQEDGREATIKIQKYWSTLRKYSVRRQILIDLLGVRAFTRKPRGRRPHYLDMAAAARLLRCSPAAARKRLQRAGEPLKRVGGRLLVKYRAVAEMLPGRDFDLSKHYVAMAELAKRYVGRSRRPIQTASLRRRLVREGAARKVGGRWMVNLRQLEYFVDYRINWRLFAD